MTSRYTHCIRRSILSRVNRSVFLMSTSDWSGPSAQESFLGSHPHQLLTIAKPIQTPFQNPIRDLSRFPELEICIPLDVSPPNFWTKTQLKKIWRPSRSRWKNPPASLVYWVKYLHINRTIAPYSAISLNIPGSHSQLRARKDTNHLIFSDRQVAFNRMHRAGSSAQYRSIMITNFRGTGPPDA